MKHYKHPTTGQVFAYDSEAEREQWGAPELVEMTEAELEPILNPPRSREEIVAIFVAAAQERLDAFARTRNYDGILSAATYATSSIPKFSAEGQRAVDLRDATWAKLYELLAEVEAGERPVPTSFAEIEAELPPLVWPA